MASALEQRYAALSQNLQQRENVQRQQEQEALRRRFAAMGALGSGAALKSEQKLGDVSARRLAEQQDQLDFARLGEQSQMEEAEKQRQFARGERLGGQEFAAEQAGLGRQFQTGERIGSQQFAGFQADLQRQFARGERLGSQEYASGEAKLGREFQTGERIGAQQFASGERMGAQEFASQEAQRGRAFTKEERVSAQSFAQKQAEAERVARSTDLVTQLRSQEAQQFAARELQKEMFSKEFDINAIVSAYNMGWRPAGGNIQNLASQLRGGGPIAGGYGDGVGSIESNWTYG